MKKSGIVILLVSIFFACSDSSNKYKITGKISAAYNDYVYLHDYTDGEFVITDSAKAYNGDFKMEGSVIMPELRYLTLSGSQDSYKFFIENSHINIDVDVDSIDNSKVVGSATHDLFTKYNQDNKVYKSQLSEIYQDYKAASEDDNQTLVDSLSDAYDKVEEEQHVFVRTFIGEHSNSVIAPYLIRSKLIYSLELADLENLTADIDLSIAESRYTKWLFKRIEILRKVAVGQPFTDFTLNDIDGSPFSLSDLQGNIILVDFWASWCKPCRVENPNVVKLYEKYNAQGFDILGVSFDNKYDDWLDAINKDRLTWNHVSDLKGWGNAAGKMYGVMSIPHTVLIDRDGLIAAKNLRGDELEEKLKELLEM